MPPVGHVFADAKDFVVFLFLDTFQGRSVPPVGHVFADAKDFVVSPVSRHFPYSRDFVVLLFLDTFNMKYGRLREAVGGTASHS